MVDVCDVIINKILVLFLNKLNRLFCFFLKECVYEDLDLKWGVYVKIDGFYKDDVIIVSVVSVLIFFLIF